MREIKFRAYHKEEKKMCRVETLRNVGAYLIGVMPNEDQILPDLRMRVASPKDGRFCDKDEFELMQYTGLKDKNGKEIYEGDIVKINTFMNVAERDDDFFESKDVEQEIISKVIYKYASFELETIQEDRYLKEWGFFDEDVDKETIEVIGNIYENPELLDKEVEK